MTQPSKITTATNTFTFTPDTEHFVEQMFERDLIWFCANCACWHITQEGEQAGLEQFFLDAIEATDEASKWLDDLRGQN